MAIKKGICKNYGECTLADEHVVQEVEVFTEEEFVCQECGCGLELSAPVTPPSSSNKKILIAAACLLAVAGLGAGGYFLSKDKLGGGKEVSTPQVEPQVVTPELALSKDNAELTVGETDKLEVSVTPEGAALELNWASQDEKVVTVADGVVKAVGEGVAKVVVWTPVGNTKVKAICTYTVKGRPLTTDPNPDGQVTNKDVGYGKYTGAWKSGKPHGFGTLVYTKTTVINPGDIEQITAKPGESVQGQFVNGKFTIGKHFNANGELIEALNLGVE